jgi:putative OPT family oligopeptide transporter
MQPFIPDQASPREWTARALIFGSILGILFGASSVYLALKVGLTVSASIPIAVLAITLLKRNGAILENNLVQTIGSAGESIAAGVVFTLPALLILGYDLPAVTTALVALTGGCLGVMLMVPLRRALIVGEHGKLLYPEGTACAQVLIAGETGGNQAQSVFWGLGIGIVYKFLMSGLKLWQEVANFPLSFFKGATASTAQIAVLSAEVSPELLGVGYIIGLRVGATLLGGGLLSYGVLIPLIKLFGDTNSAMLFGSTDLISTMTVAQVRSHFIYYIGVGAVATGGLFSLLRALPAIGSALRGAWASSQSQQVAEKGRTQQDLPLPIVLGGIGLVFLLLIFLPPLHLSPLAAVLVLVCGFFFTTVSARIAGQIGSSSNPISGMTVATLLLTCGLFVATGQVGPEMRPLAILVAAVVCIAIANAGNTAQDLKTGYLVGATPRLQQGGLLIGALTSALAVGWTLILLNQAYTTVVPVYYPTAHFPLTDEPSQLGPDGKSYHPLRLLLTQQEVPVGQYLLNQQGEPFFRIDAGIGGRENQMPFPITKPTSITLTGQLPLARGLDGKLYQRYDPVPTADNQALNSYLLDTQGQIRYELRTVPKLPSPKAQIMALITDGILTGQLPWNLILLGAFISIVMELCGVQSLPFAVGLYLPISTSAPVFCGGLVRWWVTRERATEETDRGTLFSSGLIAGGTMGGLVLAALAVAKLDQTLDLSQLFPWFSQSALWAGVMFCGLIGVLLFQRDQAS